jgi:hypothetical protein
MRGNGWATSLASIIIGATLSACGVYTPDKDPFKNDTIIDADTDWTSGGRYESLVVNHVACEISQGLTRASVLKLPWLRQWGTTVTQTITVEDQTGLSPGISAVAPLPNSVLAFPASNGGNVTLPQSTSVSVGGTASANGLRTETIQYTFRNQDLLDSYNSGCLSTINGVMMDGNLKIAEFIYDKASVSLSHAIQLASDDPYVPGFNTFTEEITFVATYGASVTPTWHLARLTANTSSNLLVAQRTNTNDLIITLGAIKCPAPPTPQPKSRLASFSALLDALEQGRVHSVLIQGSEIYSQLDDGRVLRTYAPNDPGFVQRLYEKHVQIRAVPAKSQTDQCPKNGPVQLVDAAMNQHQARVSANALATSVTGQTH